MDKTTKTFCFNCQNETNQKICFEKNEFITPELIPYDKNGKRGASVWTVELLIWKVTECLGCEKVNFTVHKRFDPKQNDILISSFPKKEARQLPYWVSYLKREYIDLFIEIYMSLNFGHNRLPLMGLRTLLDMYIVEKIGDVGTFKVKLKRLVEEKIISSSSADLLEIALEYGHAAVHRGYIAENEEIMGVLDIIENLLEGEALKSKSTNLKRIIPKTSLKQ